MKTRTFKRLCFILFVCVALALNACGSADPAPAATSSPEPTPVNTPEPTPEPTPMPTVQSVDIHYAGSKLEDFTMKVGERVPLSVAVLPADLPLEVEWSTDPEGESAFVFHVSEDDPGQCELECVGPLPEDSGGVRIYAQVYGGKASALVHVLSIGVAAPTDQTVEIHYVVTGEKLSNFTMKVGESLPLQAVPLTGSGEGLVTWSMDEAAKSSLRFVADESDPYTIYLECFAPLPPTTSRVGIYAELDGVKTACVVYVK